MVRRRCRLLTSFLSKSSTTMREGIDNLLQNCIGVKAGESLVIVSERGAGGYYSATIDEAIAAQAREYSIDTQIIEAPVCEQVDVFPPAIKAAIDEADHTLFLARLGDQVRFGELCKFGSYTMCYALDEESFASPFCSAHHGFFLQLKDRINQAIFGGRTIEIRCAAGTRLKGISPSACPDQGAAEVSLKRFPMTVFRPVCCKQFSGQVALTGWLAPTGSRIYEPSGLLLDGTVIARVENGRMLDFDGERADVERVRAHYQYVADRYGIDGMVLHSWHAGIHPQNGYVGAARDNPARWSGSAFGNPRSMHLHTCGDYAPGEISVSVFDPTILVDGVEMWRDGRLTYADYEEVRDLQSQYPGMRELFDNPVLDYGF